MQLCALGMFVFGLGTFAPDELARDEDFNHARAPRVGARDASQFVGPGQDNITIPGTIVPEAAGSYGSIDTLRTMAAEGEAWAFVDGAGTVWGNYVITRLGQRRRHLLDDGTPRLIEFTIDLERVD